ncbi:[Fe-Fe] hydrogenase large subunit C-terminal domain-containing protein [Halanaerobacter jeridensis]|uniref:Iron only hydrogenase large subunit-like protein n=1 Tax=Halanaerobacter jeridensis TaxID=706427 RepID=A0A938XTS2_9FIRM|nr:[Fe-Fe] hydrogenase large subunit C-terminal domain-containing protein [Halanaerobacter jeridensis]MBM7556166.1 iron only hydrogenase large subunit-like protein [Halanaerobacter jeridensis]
MTDLHSVLLDEDKCEGCTNCVKNCPTDAIRVHQGQAIIKDEKCIDCGECVRSCQHHAKQISTDGLDKIGDYKHPIVLVAPSFYGQFTTDIDPVKIVIAFKQLGFEEVWDVALGAEALTRKTAQYLKDNEGPIISSSCPTVVRLIKLLYPELLDYLAPFKSPVQLVAQRAKERAIKEKGFAEEEVGVFFITPCPAKMTTVNNPLGLEKSYVDGAIAVDKIYRKLLKKVKNMDVSMDYEEYETPYLGISWGKRGGEADLLSSENTISVTGIHNVTSILDELDRGDLPSIKYFELVSCEPGCVGGVLNVKNPFVAQFNIENLVEDHGKFIEQSLDDYDFELDKEFTPNTVAPLDDDFASAMAKLTELEEEIDELPGLDCAACGAPDCRTLAEDIINGLANRTDCIFILRQQLAELTDEMSSLAHSLPPIIQDEGD